MGFLKSLRGTRGQQPGAGSAAVAKGAVLDADLTFAMVDFYAEHALLIKLGLARSPRDIESMKFYRITAQNRGAIKPENGLLLRNARVICDGKLQGLGCDGVVAVTNPLLPSPDGHLLLQMKGPLDAMSKCLATCSCGVAFMLYADATVGQPGECYLAVVRLQQPAEARLSVVPFFEADGMDVVRL